MKENLPAPRMRRIAADKLAVDPAFQRDLIPARVKRIAEGLDLDALGVFTVSERKGSTFALLDGQHRKAALEFHGMGEWEVWCRIYAGLTSEQEAGMFRLLNDTRRISAWDDFKAGLVAKDPECVGIRKIVNGAGFEVSNQSREGFVTCVSTLRSIYRKDGGPDALRRALDDSREAWGITTVGVEGDVLSGLAFVHLSYNGSLDRAAFVEKLAKVKPAALLAHARAAREFRTASVARLVAAAAIQYYNRGRRVGKLDDL